MKHVGPIELHNVSLPEAFGRPVKRKSFLKRLIIALHYSRRRQARNLIRSYRHLIADDILGPSSASLNSNNEKESSQNANADQTAVRTGSRADNA
jgi:hypothetical protein